MERKKIVFILPSLTSGGAERVVSILANKFLEVYDVTIILLYKTTPFYFLDESVRIKFCRKKYNSKTNLLKSLSNHIYMIKQVYRFTKGQDILIGFTTTCNVYAILVSKFMKIPSIISERLNPNYSAENIIWKTIRKLIYPKTDKVILQTNSIKDYYKRFIAEDKLQIIPNPIAPELQKHFNSNQTKENIILTVGRFSKQKNRDTNKLSTARHLLLSRDRKTLLKKPPARKGKAEGEK